MSASDREKPLKKPRSPRADPSATGGVIVIFEFQEFRGT